MEEQCDEFVSLVSVRFQGLKTIDVIERNGLPKNSVAFEPGDLEVNFVCVFPTLLRTFFSFFKGGGDPPPRGVVKKIENISVPNGFWWEST